MESDAELIFIIMLRVAVLAFPKACHVFLWKKKKRLFSYWSLAPCLSQTEDGRCESDRGKVCHSVLQNTFILGFEQDREPCTICELMLGIVTEARLALSKSQQIREVQVFSVIVQPR